MQEKSHQITGRTAAAFAAALRMWEYSEGTIANYLRSVRAFAAWSSGTASRSRAAGWKAHLAGSHAPATVNTMLAGVNCFFVTMGWEECRAKPLRLQRRSFQDPERELCRADYRRLVQTARTLGRERLALLMETICATGIRVGGGALYHSGGRPGGNGLHFSEGQGLYHPAAGQALPQAAAVCPGARPFCRPGFSHRRRPPLIPDPDLGGDEAALPGGGGGGLPGVPPQSAPPLCPHILRSLPGHREAGGHSGPQLTPPASTSAPLGRSMSGSWSGCICCVDKIIILSTAS